MDKPKQNLQDDTGTARASGATAPQPADGPVSPERPSKPAPQEPAEYEHFLACPFSIAT